MEPVDDITEGVGGIKISGSMFRHINTSPIKEVYKITRKIGSGAYGEVRK